MYNISMNRKRVVVIAGPSGSGETTCTNELCLAYPNFARAVSATTRSPRPGELDGVDYHFMSKERFLDCVQDKSIPEYIFVRERDAYYGSYLPDIEQKMNDGKTIVVNTDLSGTRYFKREYGATTIFIKPKSIDVLRDRFRRRDPSITDEEVDLRTLAAYKEMVEATENYDYAVSNTDGEFADTILHVIEILKREGYQVSGE